MARIVFGLDPTPRAALVWIMLVASMVGLLAFLRALGIATVPALSAVILFTVWTGMIDVSAGFFASSPYMQVLGVGLWALTLCARYVGTPDSDDKQVAAPALLLMVTATIDNAGLWVIPASIIVALGTPSIESGDGTTKRRRCAIAMAAAVGLVMAGVHIWILRTGASGGDLLSAGRERTVIRFVHDIGFVIACSWSRILFGPLSVERAGALFLVPLGLFIGASFLTSGPSGRRIIGVLLFSLVVAAAFVAIGRPGISERGANSQHLWIVGALLVSLVAAALNTVYVREPAWRTRTVEITICLMMLTLPPRLLGLLSAKSDWAYRRVEANAVRSIGRWLKAKSVTAGPLSVPWVGGERISQTVQGLGANPYDIDTYSPFLAAAGANAEFVVPHGSGVHERLGVRSVRTLGAAISSKLLEAIRREPELNRMFFGPIDLTLDSHPFTLDMAPLQPHNTFKRRNLAEAAAVSARDKKFLQFASTGNTSYYLWRGEIATEKYHRIEMSVWRVSPPVEAKVFVVFDTRSSQRLAPDWVVVPNQPMMHTVLRVNLLRQPKYALNSVVRNLRLVFSEPGTYVMRAAGVHSSAETR